MLVSLRFKVVCCLLIIICMLWQSCKESNTSLIRRSQHEAIGTIMKHQEVSKSFRRCQEARGSIRKAQHENNNNNNIYLLNTLALKPQVDSKISTDKKQCQLITLLIKECKKALLITDKTQVTKPNDTRWLGPYLLNHDKASLYSRVYTLQCVHPR